MKIVKRALAGAMLLGAFAAPAAQAQVVTFSTVGSSFGASPIPSVVCTQYSCVGGGFNLTFDPVIINSATPSSTPTGFSNINLGNFLLTGTGTGGTVPSGFFFTLAITQTSPVAGGTSTPGTLSGFVSATGSTLVWVPDMTSLSIDGVRYNLKVESDTRGVSIGINNTANPASINATVSVVPEPASMALLGTGLLGMFGGVIRNRRKGTSDIAA